MLAALIAQPSLVLRIKDAQENDVVLVRIKKRVRAKNYPIFTCMRIVVYG